MNNTPLVTIVTVTYNPKKEDLLKTLKSVLAQDFTDFEYLVQDGGSNNGTMEIVAEYEQALKDKGISVQVVSGKDNGIYDAMNKAVSSATGTWVNFMNAGDCFYAENTLSSLFSQRDYEGIDIVYGDAVECEYGHYYLFRKGFQEIEKRMPFSHQSAFARRELLLDTPFDLRFPIGADYNFFLWNYKRGKQFKDSGEKICIVSKDGVSSVNLYDTFAEAIAIKSNNNVPIPTEKEQKKLLRISSVKQFVMDYFPVFIKKAIRSYQIEKRGQNAELTIPSWEKGI